MIRKLRILLWRIASDFEQRLYPYEKEDNNDYYYTIKNEETGENYMIIEWIKSFDERIQRIQDEMLWIKSELNIIKKDKNG
jgi:hypothetical protein